MKKLMIKFVLVAALFVAGILAGCSDSGTPVSSLPGGGMHEAAGYPDHKDVRFEFILDLMPFAEASVSAPELGILCFTSATVTPFTGTVDESEFCRQIEIQTDSPAEKEISDCATGDIKASKINIRNTGKKRLSAIAVITGKSLFGMIENGK